MKKKHNKRIFIQTYILLFIFSITYFYPDILVGQEQTRNLFDGQPTITEDENTVTLNEERISKKREITADSLRWEYEAKTAVFTGNVIMNGNEGEIRCLKMTAFFDEEDEIKKIIAEETATLIREKQKGGGEIIEIYPDQDLLILKQEAWISSDKALFKGEEIRFDTQEDIINITKGVKGEIQTGNTEE